MNRLNGIKLIELKVTGVDYTISCRSISYLSHVDFHFLPSYRFVSPVTFSPILQQQKKKTFRLT